MVTGGLGYIGSHVVVELLNLDKYVIIIDNLSNSNKSVLDKLFKITNKPNNILFFETDIRNEEDLIEIFEEYPIDLVMHFAALKSVSESEKYPDLYINGTKTLLSVMEQFNCKKFIYSSSATVYGDSSPPVSEDSKVGSNLACNYAKNKYDMEQYMINNCKNDWSIVILRYFNPIGAHSSGLIGDDPNGIPNNIFPYLLRVAKWSNSNPTERNENSPYKSLTIFGDDYDTKDGTCIRDYVHVEDLALSHLSAISKLSSNGIFIYNVGTGY